MSTPLSQIYYMRKETLKFNTGTDINFKTAKMKIYIYKIYIFSPAKPFSVR